MGWRDKYKVHSAADIGPMMSDEELAELGEDIKASGLKEPITFDAEGAVLDGRNRLEAMERAGIALRPCDREVFLGDDPGAHIVSKNIHRRHLTKQQKADWIVAALKVDEAKTEAEKPRQVGEVSRKGGRGKVNKLKAKAIALAKKEDVGKRTMERSLAKAEGRRSSDRKKRRRRTKAEIERDKFLSGFMNSVEAFAMVSVSDDALDLLTTKERVISVQAVETLIGSLTNIMDRLRSKDREAA